MLKKVVSGFLLLGGLIFMVGCLGQRGESGVDIDQPTSTPMSTIKSPAPIPGRPAPDFTLSDLEGNEVRLSDFRGKVVLVNFWATW